MSLKSQWACLFLSESLIVSYFYGNKSDTSVIYEVSKTLPIISSPSPSDTPVKYEVSKTKKILKKMDDQSDTPVKYEVSKTSNSI